MLPCMPTAMLCIISSQLGFGESQMLDKLLYEEEARRCMDCFEQQVGDSAHQVLAMVFAGLACCCKIACMTLCRHPTALFTVFAQHLPVMMNLHVGCTAVAHHLIEKLVDFMHATVPLWRVLRLHEAPGTGGQKHHVDLRVCRAGESRWQYSC